MVLNHKYIHHYRHDQLSLTLKIKRKSVRVDMIISFLGTYHYAFICLGGKIYIMTKGILQLATMQQ